MGNVAACDLGCAILENASHQTVIRCEINFQAAVLGSFRECNTELVAQVRDAANEAGRSLTV
eukprot:11166090-Alexandrium_andersonii.AAC.1